MGPIEQALRDERFKRHFGGALRDLTDGAIHAKPELIACAAIYGVECLIDVTRDIARSVDGSLSIKDTMRAGKLHIPFLADVLARLEMEVEIDALEAGSWLIAFPAYLTFEAVTGLPPSSALPKAAAGGDGEEEELLPPRARKILSAIIGSIAEYVGGYTSLSLDCKPYMGRAKIGDMGLHKREIEMDAVKSARPLDVGAKGSVIESAAAGRAPAPIGPDAWL